MKKLILFVTVLFVAGITHGQTLTAGGTIIDAHGGIVGYYKGDGTVENSAHKVVGYIKQNGNVEDGHHKLVGYLKNDGSLEDANHNVLGHAKTNEVKFNVVFSKLFFKS